MTEDGKMELLALADEQDGLAKAFRAMCEFDEVRACELRASSLRLAASLPDGSGQRKSADGGNRNEKSAQGLSLATDPELLALIERAKSHVMSPAERYEQRRSFVRGMCPSRRDYGEWCAEVDKLLPPLSEQQSAQTLSRATGGEG